MVDISPSIGHSGAQGPAIFVAPPFLKFDLQDALCLMPQKRKNMEENVGEGFVGSPGNDGAASLLCTFLRSELSYGAIQNCLGNST